MVRVLIFQSVFYGGARYTAVAGPGPFPLKYQTGRVQVIEPTDQVITAKLPSAVQDRFFKVGGPVFYLVNIGGFAINVITNLTENPAGTLNPNQAGVWCCVHKLTGDGAWMYKIRDLA